MNKEATAEEIQRRFALAVVARRYFDAVHELARAINIGDRTAGNHAVEMAAGPLSELLIDAHLYMRDFYPELEEELVKEE